jgi:hypothetical protein
MMDVGRVSARFGVASASIVGFVPVAADEGRHAPGSEEWWGESWYFDFWAAEGGLGGFARLSLYPNQKTAWWWSYLVGHERPLVMLRDHHVRLPRAGMEIRDTGVWACLTPETPHDHWSVGLEAFAVALDPADALGDERGDVVPLGLDLEWEAAADVVDAPGTRDAGYHQACEVYGDVLVGDERIEVTGYGHRSHRWGILDWSDPGGWVGGRLDNQSWLCAHAPLATHDGLLQEGVTDNAGSELRVIPLLHAPVLLAEPHHGKAVPFLARALCRLESCPSAGPSVGFGWAEVGGHAPL